jgi:CRP-like cAMP-binding protein
VIQPERLLHGQVVRVLRGVDLFATLSDADLERVQTAGEVRRLGAGETLFRAGDPPDRIHVVLAGAIEIVRSTPDHPEPIPVAYVSPGEALGDMGLLTGSPRRSSGRAPEHAEIWTVDRNTFEGLTRTIPGYGMQIATVFARRLEEFITHVRGQSRRKELAGKLRYFDLPTVVQTLVSANQTGVLTLTDAKGTTFAEVLLHDGAVERARCGPIEGDEAFYQLFMGPADAEFYFRSVAEPSRDAVSRVPISLSAMNLLMEAMRLVDELPEMRRRLPDPERPYRARTDELNWKDDRTLRAAHEILARLRTPRPIGALVGEVPCCTYTLYRIAADLHATKQIE